MKAAVLDRTARCGSEQIHAENLFFTTRNGLKIAAEQAGPDDAPVVVLLHGGGQTRHSWRRSVGAFGDAGYHAMSYDARGHGESDWALDGDYSFDALAGDLVDVLNGESKPVALIGASMGGLTAYLAEGRSLLDIAALILVDIVPKPSRSGGERIISFMTSHPEGFSSLEDAADAVAAYYPERARPRDVSGLRRNLRMRDDGRFHWHWDPRLLGDPAAARPPEMAAWAVPLAGQIRAPTLVIRGGNSDVVDDAAVAETRRLIPSVEVVQVAGSGHMIAGDRNDAFTRSAMEFVRRHLPLEC